ncbi:pinin/SDK/memA/ protein conserved region-domain-containing protein [Halteromyces radiatus]|uniref:pinin/SDK/memA/ protein conserved region-domain-containing protein n=1 Tax=Halteromyces radiatus TaxID=101107 RepID=UPI00221F7711|nr:pinin/SDK/memA/ protein conserved region-domain-containing protein [Halteromyces radiatus]KAI8093783.1 pinin/SDK/memA/ protein conserved region-domain-containing protein [Halteromyces radiatus]
MSDSNGLKRTIDQVVEDEHSDQVNDQQVVEDKPKEQTRLENNNDISKQQQKRRGQRLFGVVLGTLNKFNSENTQRQEQARNRQAIEAKLQKRLDEEKSAIQASLLKDQEERSRIKQQQQQDLDQKRIQMVHLHQQRLACYLTTTSTSPPLKYLPKVLLPHQKQCIDDQISQAAKATTESVAQTLNHPSSPLSRHNSKSPEPAD